jgi:LPXTG-motif cell wall-anchored protein
MDQDFTLQAADAPTPTPNPPVDPTDPPVAPVTPPGTGNGALPATGLGPETVTWGAVGAGVLVLGAGLFAFSRRRSNSATRDSDAE